MKLFALLFVLGVTSGCEKEEDETDNFPIRFEFRLLDNQGEERNRFQEGDNIIFSFLMINDNNEDFYFRSMTGGDDFLKVKQQSENTAIGKPYRTIFCEYAGGILIPAKDTLKLEIPWEIGNREVPKPFCEIENQDPLPRGEYNTSFTSVFQVSKGEEDYQSAPLTFSIDFSME